MKCGTKSAYNRGCRCAECREANAAKQREYRRRAGKDRYLLRRERDRLAYWRAYFGGSCQVCGSTAHLQFDHIDPETKLMNPSYAIRNRSDAVLAAEMAKCQLLCASCHSKKTKDLLYSTK